MSFYGYKGDFDECSYYDFASAPNQDSSVYSSYASGESEFSDYNSSSYFRNDSYVNSSEPNYSVYAYSEPQVIQYDPIKYHDPYNYYDYSSNLSHMNHNIYSYNEPKLLQYNPSSHDQCYLYSETKFTISYSKVAYNDTDFDDYDSTPYDGGFDPATTYGKPLPPSDQTCYPRYVPDPHSLSLPNFSYASTPSPYGKYEGTSPKPSIVNKPIVTKTDPEPSLGKGDKVITSDTVEPLDVIPSKEAQTPPKEREIEHKNGTNEGYGNDINDCKMQQIPYGSGLETMDICESIFGYWPCLAKKEQQEKQNKLYAEERRDDPWKTAADYLFGYPLSCNYESYHHLQEQSSYY